jgi:hypothetical protein
VIGRPEPGPEVGSARFFALLRSYRLGLLKVVGVPLDAMVQFTW